MLVEKHLYPGIMMLSMSHIVKLSEWMNCKSFYKYDISIRFVTVGVRFPLIAVAVNIAFRVSMTDYIHKRQ